MDVDAGAFGNQNLGRNRFSVCQARGVLSSWLPPVASCTLNASDGQSLVDLDLFRIRTRADQDRPSWRRSIYGSLNGRERRHVIPARTHLNGCGHQLTAKTNDKNDADKCSSDGRHTELPLRLKVFF